jgi:glycosyltransferase involved in cell wall biosynthesis
LLYAWKNIVNNSEQKVQLELWGEGPLEFELKILCKDLNINDSVIFRGHMDSVQQNLKHMDIFVLASSVEGNSNAILEAMAAGLPIVCTRVGGASMQIGPEGERFLVEPGDQDSLQNKLMELIENSMLRKKLGSTMHKRILSNFEIHKVADTYITAYSFLAKRKYNLIGKTNH